MTDRLTIAGSPAALFVVPTLTQPVSAHQAQQYTFPQTSIGDDNMGRRP
jgi:hypothetical protein